MRSVGEQSMERLAGSVWAGGSSQRSGGSGIARGNAWEVMAVAEVSAERVGSVCAQRRGGSWTGVVMCPSNGGEQTGVLEVRRKRNRRRGGNLWADNIKGT